MAKTSDDALVRAAVRLATTVRMGDGVDSSDLRDFRREVSKASTRWRAAGAVEVAEVAILLELYPALTGSVGLYPANQSREVEDLALALLDEALRALSGESNSGSVEDGHLRD